jgi:hypothetical protein
MTAGSEGVGYITSVSFSEDNTPVYDTVTLPLPNSSFDGGLSFGWTTDRSEQILVDSSRRGSGTSPETSIAFFGGTQYAHLFSPDAFTDILSSYVISVYADTTDFISGELGFYIDEYDTGGNWISGKWLGAATNGTVADLSFPYSPTSASVVSSSVQVYLTAGSEGVGYIDDVQMNILEL